MPSFGRVSAEISPVLTRSRQRSKRYTSMPRSSRQRTGRRSSGSTEHLFAISPTPVVALNRAIAVGEVEGPATALASSTPSPSKVSLVPRDAGRSPRGSVVRLKPRVRSSGQRSSHRPNESASSLGYAVASEVGLGDGPSRSIGRAANPPAAPTLGLLPNVALTPPLTPRRARAPRLRPSGGRSRRRRRPTTTTAPPSRNDGWTGSAKSSAPSAIATSGNSRNAYDVADAVQRASTYSARMKTPIEPGPIR